MKKLSIGTLISGTQQVLLVENYVKFWEVSLLRMFGPLMLGTKLNTFTMKNILHIDFYRL